MASGYQNITGSNRGGYQALSMPGRAGSSSAPARRVRAIGRSRGGSGADANAEGGNVKINVNRGDRQAAIEEKEISSEEREARRLEAVTRGLGAQQKLQDYTQGMSEDQIVSRKAREEFDAKKTKDAEAARWKNATRFASEAEKLDPDKNGSVVFKDPNVLTGVVKDWNPAEEVVDPETGLSTFQDKNLVGRYVAGPEGTAPKMHLFTLGKDGVETPVMLPNGSPFQMNRDAMTQLSKMDGLYQNKSEMQKADANRAQASAVAKAAGEQELAVERAKHDPAAKLNALVSSQKNLLTLRASYQEMDKPIPDDLLAEIDRTQAYIQQAQSALGNGGAVSPVNITGEPPVITAKDRGKAPPAAPNKVSEGPAVNVSGNRTSGVDAQRIVPGFEEKLNEGWNNRLARQATQAIDMDAGPYFGDNAQEKLLGALNAWRSGDVSNINAQAIVDAADNAYQLPPEAVPNKYEVDAARAQLAQK